MSGSLFFLNYQIAKAKSRASLLLMPLPELKANIQKSEYREKTSVWLEKTNADALTWAQSFVDPDSTPYKQRRNLVAELKAVLDAQETELASRTNLDLWTRLCFPFAGLSAFLPGRNTALFLAVVLSLSLMVTALAVMS